MVSHFHYSDGKNIGGGSISYSAKKASARSKAVPDSDYEETAEDETELY